MTRARPNPRPIALAGLGAFAGLVALQHLWRADDLPPADHFISEYSVGDGGWVQVVAFCATGGLVLACAAGLRRVLVAGPAARVVPRLVAVVGGGLVAAGVFTTDPGAGFPAGAPEGAPELSWHGVLHEVSHLAVVGAWIALCLVLRRRFARQGDRGWARACVAVVPLALAVAAFPHPARSASGSS